MSLCCFICNNSAKVALRNAISIFKEHNKLQSGKKLSEIISELIEKPVQENKVHSNIVCKKCYAACSEYDVMQERLILLKKEILEQFRLSLYCHHLKYDTYETSFDQNPKKVIPGKKLVLSASKLQPISQDLLLKVGKLAQFPKTNVNNQQSKTKSPPSINLKVTVGSSVLTQSIPTVSLSNTSNTTTVMNTIMSENSDMSENSTLVHNMDEEEKQYEVQTTEFVDDTELSCIDDSEKFILSKLQIMNEDNGDTRTILVDGDKGSILRVMSGQKLLYEEAEVMMIDDDHDNGDSHDSNDESQIELQVSGDEETANAIIAAAQEQGGAFIKVESGEMFRLKSVGNVRESSDALNIVEKIGNHFKCLLCEKNDDPPFIGDADVVMSHLKKLHDVRLYICQMCGAVLTKRSDYTAHIAEHAQKLKPASKHAPLRCETCGKTYSSRSLLQEHCNIHTGHRPYVCEVCSKAFASKYTLQAHLKTHSIRPRPYKCQQCNKCFLSQQNLSQHEKTHSGVKHFVCNICEKAFSTQHNLEVHGIVHSRVRPFVCTVCKKAFARRNELRDHTRTHTGERPYECEQCGARFAQRSNLHSHRRATHLDDKRHHCTLCPKRFKRKRLLEYHIKASHTGERPLVCPMCPATFVYPEHFKKHTRIHSGERPFLCEICGKSFNSRDNRNTHRFVHSHKKPYECVACGAGYMRKQHLYAHMNSSGHLAESIVVNQPRVVKLTENTQASAVQSIEEHKLEAIFETTPELSAEDKTDDKTLNLIEDNNSSLLTLHNLDARILNTVDMEMIPDDAEIVANDENGEMVRLVQIKLADGNSGWMAINS